MIILPFDSETTDIPLWKEKSDLPKQPHIVSLAALRIDEETREIKDTFDMIVRPDGWSWDEDNEAFQKHGITMEKAMEFGHPEKDVVEEFMLFSGGVKYTIAYNTTFDIRIIRIALKRYFPELVDMWKAVPYQCAMKKARQTLELKKNCKLEEAYKALTGKDLVGAHNAMNDTFAAWEVFQACLDYPNLDQPIMPPEIA